MNIVMWATIIAALLLIPAVALVAWRMLAGPSSADRVIATDMLGLLGISLASLATAYTGYTAYLDIGVGVALISFLGAVAFASLLERGQLLPGTDRRAHQSDGEQ